MVVAGYLGSLGLTSDAHRGSRSVLRATSQIGTVLFSHRSSFAPWSRHRELRAQCSTVNFISLGSRSHSAYPRGIATLGAAHSRGGTRPWLTAAELAQRAPCLHRSTSAWFAWPPFATVVAPHALTTRSTRTPTGGAARLGGRRLPWFVRRRPIDSHERHRPA